MKNWFSIILVTLSLGLTACSNQVSYGDPGEVETVNTDFGSTDLQTVAAQMTDSLLQSPVVADLTRDGRPVVFVERIKNKTSEHIDTESITDSISTRILRSGKFRFVDMDRVEAVGKQLEFQNESGFVDPATASQFGKQIGAEYMLYGNLSSIVKDNGKQRDVYYKFTMRLMDLESGIIEWADETEIRKVEERNKLGW